MENDPGQDTPSSSDADAQLLADAARILTPITLPSGRVVPNRLIKAPLYEHLAPLGGSGPHDGFLALYRTWAAGGWGMVMTGNVQVARDHLSLGRDLAVPAALDAASLAPWRALADTIHAGPCVSSSPGAVSVPVSVTDAGAGGGAGRVGGGPLAIMQLSHAGRQSLNILGGRPPFAPPLAPSPIRLGEMHQGKDHDDWLSRLAHWAMLQVPQEMTHADIQRVVAQFVCGARLAALSGFDGVEVHAAHGYLLSEFISPKTNRRTDAYAADRDPLRLLREIVEAIRAPGVVPEDFIVGVKLNAADYARGTYELQEHRALDHVREIGQWGLLDFIQVSGGDYEDPQFIDKTREHTPRPSTRQVIYEAFAERSIAVLSARPPPATATAPTSAPARPPPLVILTGGLTTLPRMASALARGHTHLLGIGRLSITHPALPAALSAALARRDARFLCGSPSSSPSSPSSHSSSSSSSSSPPTAPTPTPSPWHTPAPHPTPLGRAPRTLLSARTLERAMCALCLRAWACVPAEMPRVVGATAHVNWYNYLMRCHALGEELDYTVGTVGAMVRFFVLPAPHPDRVRRSWWAWAWAWAWALVVGLVGVLLGVGLGLVM